MDVVFENDKYFRRDLRIFAILLCSGAVSTAIFVFYLHSYVDGHLLNKVAYYVVIAAFLGSQLLYCTVIKLFYNTIRVKFTLLNGYFRLVCLMILIFD